MQMGYSPHLKFEIQPVGSLQSELKSIHTIISICMKPVVIPLDCSSSSSPLIYKFQRHADSP